MQALTLTPASAYRRVDLDARIEASKGEDLTLICLEEAVAALGQALLALEREPATPPRDALVRAHSIAVWLARSVAPDNPLHAVLTDFYATLAAGITRSLAKPDPAVIAAIRKDFADVLAAARPETRLGAGQL